MNRYKYLDSYTKPEIVYTPKFHETWRARTYLSTLVRISRVENGTIGYAPIEKPCWNQLDLEEFMLKFEFKSPPPQGYA